MARTANPHGTQSPKCAALRRFGGPDHVENCGNTLILRYSASERSGTAEFASRLNGKARDLSDAKCCTIASQISVAPCTKTQSTSEQHVTEAAVMASPIEAPLRPYWPLLLAARPEWRCVALTRRDLARP